jgi:cytoskeletal protein CcmA (bactofilin family)
VARVRRRHRPGDAVSGSGAVLSSSAIVGADPGARRNLIVEGRIDAEVPLHAHGVSIGATGRVRGDIYGATIRVEGEVVGDLFGEAEVKVCSSGSVEGKITAPNVVLEDGATFKGQILVQDSLATVAPMLGAAGPAIVTA